jgi:hypothetical protein
MMSRDPRFKTNPWNLLLLSQLHRIHLVFLFPFCHSCVYLLSLHSSRSVCSTTTAKFLVAHVHPPVSLSTRNVWKRIFGSDVCPLYLLLVFPLTQFRRDFLETLDDGSFFSPPTTVGPSLVPNTPFASSLTPTQNASTALALDPSTDAYPSNSGSHSTVKPAAPILPAATKTEKFFLTAADQESGSRDERLNSVIQSKYEAGLLKPYNYVKGYARLSRWMDCKFVLLFSRPDPLYSPLRFCKRVPRIETTDLTAFICAKTKIQGKRTL